ncbi:tetratricopeptide repeat-containing protein [Parafilimonas sp.]|uniref:tetratricopeptide repeat-containing protein n=1 Tax=Parafilimonas sp. TaxID=1969739 RepID=UPI0039E53224
MSKKCFVVMGFGVKTDYTTGRKLDLNKSYQYLIKPVLAKKGWECVRADEIPNTGVIDLQMYLELLQADVVIADLSTTNANAIYELGIRHALRPFTTIVIAEDKLAYPFDLNHIAITKYTHLGDSIDYGEAERFHSVLDGLLDAAAAHTPPPSDSPVYTFIGNLMPPKLQDQIDEIISSAKTVVDAARTDDSPAKTLALICNEAEDALNEKRFSDARALFNTALLLKKSNDKNNISSDSYIIQRLALATYKAGEPDVVTALHSALELLGELNLDHTNDPETVALAGSIEKKLYENGQGDEHLKNAILFNERGYFLLNNRYNAINLAYAFNCRVDSNLYPGKEDKIADLIFANRVRHRILHICESDWNDIMQREAGETAGPGDADANEIQKQKNYNNEQKFWILVNKAEAYFGLGMFDEYKQAVGQAQTIEHADWMMQSFREQVDKLKILLNKYGSLLEKPWIYREPLSPEGE